jgi:DNA-binding NtrC family response regulator
VLILAREEVVAVLLGLMVELRGLQPRFLGRAEPFEEAIRRGKPKAVLIDYDHPDCGDALMEAIIALKVGLPSAEPDSPIQSK